MIPLTLEQLADVVGGTLRGDGPAVQRVVIDSRDAGPGALFVALPGERTDGHAFVGAALAAGAACALVGEDRVGELPRDAVVVAVDDPGDALLGLGRWVRDIVDPRVVGITGSVGKTTTKDLVAAAVGAGRAVVANPSSYNNEIGVPLTCCALELRSEVLVAEIGARGSGQVARLAAVVRPDVAVVTLVAGAHLELFGDVEAVARAKGELVEALPPGGLAVLNADDPRVAAMASRTAARSTTFGLGPRAEWRAEDVVLDGRARASFRVRGIPVRLGISGAHAVGSALAALAVADEVGVPVELAAAALGAARVSHWRMELVATAAGVTVVNDAYNANPTSAAAALAALRALDVPGRRWAALGPMAELGPEGPAEHERLGRLAARQVDGVLAVGAAAAGIRRGADAAGGVLAHGPVEVEVAVGLLSGLLAPGDAVLVKASRSAGLERLVAALVEALGGPVPEPAT